MSKEYDKVAKRLAFILQKLNSGERFSTDELAEEFNVDKRTIQRDLNNRLNFLPFKKVDGLYALEEYCLGKLNYNDIRNFAMLSSIKGLYPTLEDGFIVDMLNEKVNQAYLVKGHEYEDISSKSEDFKLINVAIITKHKLHFTYNNKERVVNPYKLVNTNGIWYLVGDEKGVLKTYTLSKIHILSKSSNLFRSQKEFLKTIEENEATWFSQKSIEVTLDVDASVAEYFLRRKLLPYQTIVEKRDNGLTVSTKVSYDNEILKIVRYWLPHIKIISPVYLQEKLEDELKAYLKI